jgi:predicted GNAT family N-acyltransferase
VSDVTVRPYGAGDRGACLGLFDSNVPRFFSASERDDFAVYLDAPSGPYLVLERAGQIVACGGHASEADGTTGALCWGMADGALHGTGLGRRLTEARIEAARQTPGLTALRLSTSQHTEGFYRRYGFQTVRLTPDGFGPGLDEHEMRLELA